LARLGFGLVGLAVRVMVSRITVSVSGPRYSGPSTSSMNCLFSQSVLDFTVQCYASAVYAVVVCLSVCPSEINVQLW